MGKASMMSGIETGNSRLAQVADPSLSDAAAKHAPVSGRLAVVVLSMHRSGSSALSRTLNLLGCDAPRTLIGADQNNESGYWESDPLRVLNDQLLASAGTDWRDWRAFNAPWYRSPRMEEYLDRARVVLDAEYGTSGLFVFKDPRVARIFPFWQTLLDRAGIGIRVLMPMRHPLEVALSLKQRDDISVAEAGLIWLRNVLDAEYTSRGVPRGVVDYDQLLQSPSKTMAALQQPMELTWPRLCDKVAAEIDEFITPELRHHMANVGSSGVAGYSLGPWPLEAYEIFRRWAEHGIDATDYLALDDLRARLDGASAPMEGLVDALRTQSTRLTTTMKKAAAAQDEIATQTAAVDEARAALTQATDRADQTASQLKTAQQTLQERDGQLAAAQDEIAAAQDRIAQQADTLAQTRSALIQRSHESEETASLLKAAQQDLQAARATYDGQIAGAQQEQERLRDKLEQVKDKLTIRLSDAEAELSRLRAEAATAATRLADAESALTAARNETGRLVAEAGADAERLQKLCRAAEKSGTERAEEALILTRLLTQKEDEIIAQKRKLDQHGTLSANLARDTNALTERLDRAIGTVIEAVPRGWLGARSRLARQAALLKRSGLFDADWYARVNKDVAQAGQDPTQHFILYGRAEGRRPLPEITRSRTTPAAAPLPGAHDKTQKD